jgi:hypothetical protein
MFGSLPCAMRQGFAVGAEMLRYDAKHILRRLARRDFALYGCE